MVTERAGRARPDGLAFLAALFLWAVFLWIAYDVFTYYNATRLHLGRAEELVETGKPRDAVDLLLEARDGALQWGGRPAAAIFERFLGKPLDVDQWLASAYDSLGRYHEERHEPKLAAEAYTMALLHDPRMQDIFLPLAQQCVFTKNYELGYFTSRTAEKVDPKYARALHRFFSKFYSPPE